MKLNKTVLIDESEPIQKTVLFEDEIGLENLESTIKEKVSNSISKNDHSNTALIIALIGLLILVGIFIYKNMQDNE